MYIEQQKLLHKDDTVVVAVSGGPDSLCLLSLLHQLAPEFRLKLVVAHLNHSMRAEAAEEAEAVEAIATGLGYPFVSRVVKIRELKKELKLSEEAAGSHARYQFFLSVADKFQASKVAIGHHLDDQAETVLLNLLRGTGIDGLAGILPKTSRGKVELIRPLLCFRRSEIEDYCRLNKLNPYTDSSNLETDYTRNKLRHELIPYLEQHYNPKIKEALFGLADLAFADRRFLTAIAVRKYQSLAKLTAEGYSFDRLKLLMLPLALRRRVLRLALQCYKRDSSITRKHLDSMITLLDKGQTGRRLILPGEIVAQLTYDRLTINPQKHARPSPFFDAALVPVPGKIDCADFSVQAALTTADQLRWPPASYQAYLDYDTIPSGALTLRTRWPGARFFPQGAKGSKKLKDFLIDQKIPLLRREELPLVTVGDQIIWLAGIRIANPYRVTERTKRVLLLEYMIKLKPCKAIDNKLEGGYLK